MLAARWGGRRRLEIGPVSVPSLRDDEALVEVAWVGLCGSDLEEWRHGPVVIEPGVILGHEIAGIVAVPARDGSGPGIGARVVVDVVTGCGQCFHCRHHEEGRCSHLLVTGQQIDGGLAEYVVGRADRLIEVPPRVPLRTAALSEPLAVAVRAVRRSGLDIGATLLVIGGGTVGALVAQVARSVGAHEVAVVEPDPERYALLARFGATPLWAEDSAELADRVRRVMPERGADILIEAAGAPGVLSRAVSLVRPGGRIVLLGVSAEQELLDTLEVVLKEKTLIGSAAHMWDDDVAVAVGLLGSATVEVEPLISEAVSLEDAALAFERLDEGRPPWKMLVRISGQE